MTTSIENHYSDLLISIKFLIKHIQQRPLNQRKTSFRGIETELNKIINESTTTDWDRETANDYLDIVLRELDTIP
jgi:hypothetical protein